MHLQAYGRRQILFTSTAAVMLHTDTDETLYAIPRVTTTYPTSSGLAQHRRLQVWEMTQAEERDPNAPTTLVPMKEFGACKP